MTKNTTAHGLMSMINEVVESSEGMTQVDEISKGVQTAALIQAKDDLVSAKMLRESLHSVRSAVRDVGFDIRRGNVKKFLASGRVDEFLSGPKVDFAKEFGKMSKTIDNLASALMDFERDRNRKLLKLQKSVSK